MKEQDGKARKVIKFYVSIGLCHLKLLFHILLDDTWNIYAVIKTRTSRKLKLLKFPYALKLSDIL